MLVLSDIQGGLDCVLDLLGELRNGSVATRVQDKSHNRASTNMFVEHAASQLSQTLFANISKRLPLYFISPSGDSGNRFHEE